MNVNELMNISEEVFLSLDRFNMFSKDRIKTEEVVTMQRIIYQDVQFSNSIQIEVQFEVNKAELLFLESMTLDKNETRRQQIARYFFMMKYTMKQIAESLNISLPAVKSNIEEAKADMLRNIRKDLRANKKILGHMIGVIYNLEQQQNLMMSKYGQLDDDIKKMRKFLDTAMEGGIENHYKIEKYQRLLNELLSMQLSYLAAVRDIIKQMVSTWQVFGLTGEEAIKLVVSGGVEIDVKVEQIKTMMVKVAGIIKAEVKDKESQYRMFNQIAREVNFDGLSSRID